MSAFRLLSPYRRLVGWGLLLSAADRGLGMVLPYSSRFLLDRILLPRDLRPLPALLAVVLLATALQVIAGFLVTGTSGQAGERLIAGYRTRVQEHVGRLPMGFFDAHSKGELAARIMKDAGGVRDLLGPAALEAVGSVLTAILVVPSLLHLSWRLGLPALAFLVAAALVLRGGSRGLGPLFGRCSLLTAKLSGRLTESLSAVRVVKVYTAEEREAKLFHEGFEELGRLEMTATTGQARVTLLAAALVLLGSPLLLVLGVREVAAGRLTTGSLVAFFALLAYAAAGARHAGSIKGVLARALLSMERTEELLRIVPEGTEPERQGRLNEVPGLVFDAVTFAYEPGRPVLRDVSFSVAPGSVTALVGASGAGKSTVLSLASGFYQPASGAVVVGGHDLRTLALGPYRELLGLVTQEPFLFSDSLAANVRFARPAATEGDFDRALEASHVLEFTGRWAAGVDTPVGERGVRLSGGQQQRVCLARALLASPALLLLDEATSSLDAESEELVQQGMETLRQGRTTLVIAHRLSTIRAADQILVLRAGRIVERGTHEELLAAGGVYAKLAGGDRARLG